MWGWVLGRSLGDEEGLSLLCHDVVVWGVVCWRCGRFPRWQRRRRLVLAVCVQGLSV